MEYQLNEKQINAITDSAPTASIKNLSFLLLVANNKGIKTPEVLERMNVTKNFTAQCGKVFGDYGLGLVRSVFDRDNMRVKKWELTQEGERFFSNND